MPLFPAAEREVGLRFPMGMRGMHQVSLRVVGDEGRCVSKTTYSDPDSIPLSSSEKLQRQMISDQQLIRDAMERKLAELEGRSALEAADNPEERIP